jgi:hypothetical protein
VVIVDDAPRFTNERDNLWTNEGFADTLAMVFVRRKDERLSPLSTLDIRKWSSFRKRFSVQEMTWTASATVRGGISDAVGWDSSRSGRKS